jgi:Uma2 family endonuclease
MMEAAPVHEIRYRRAPVPIDFPEFELMSEGKDHLELRTFPYQLLKHNFAETCALGSDQFVYWNAHDPKQKLSPDVFLRKGMRNFSFGSWKVWKHGAPHLCVEVISPREGEITWEEKFDRYLQAGVEELVWFDPDGPVGERLRVWDRIDGDLVDREVQGDRTPCRTLGLHWVIVPTVEHEATLRLARDPEGEQLLSSALETLEQANAVEVEARKNEARAREQETKAREAAEQRVRELEEELRRRGG